MVTYKESGVDLQANTRWVGAIQSALRSTYGPRVFERRPGLFAGLFRLDYEELILRKNYRKPVLVGCTDGVGTKILVAIQAKRLSTIGVDLVAMNVNDLITCGGEPLFFLDYLACSKLDPRWLLHVVEGIAAGCREADCALLGGETAEMPDLYRAGDLDLAGFALGVVEASRIIDGTRVRAGDVVIGLPSSGVHSNGYTLVRKVIQEAGCRLDRTFVELGEPLVDAVLRPTRIYVKAVQAVMRAYRVKRVVTGMSHITGGGLRENIARVLPANCDAALRMSSWERPPIFGFLQRHGVAEGEMWRVFNMGIGYVFFVRPDYARGVMRTLRKAGEEPVEIGHIRRGTGRVRIR